MAEHIVSRKVYFVIFGALIFMTGVTYLAALHDFHSEATNTIIALAIAVTKATLVILYFMHVRYSPRLTWVVVTAGFFWLAIMITLTLSDYMTRNTLALPGH
ncbi:MAG TPA: cytochrome C oxidase subunit IV family protein, partial [Pyrinomonadaceae bacterium]|nr:cytochrome C oxidase subunit IV family protein [Pyrinomonadaceae bacterium]